MRRPQTSAVIMLSNMWCQWRYQDVILQMNNIPMSHDSQLMWFHSMRVYLKKMKYSWYFASVLSEPFKVEGFHKWSPEMIQIPRQSRKTRCLDTARYTPRGRGSTEGSTVVHDPVSHNHRSGTLPYMKGNKYWRYTHFPRNHDYESGWVGGGNSNSFYFFIPIVGEDVPIWLAHIYQMRWFNHQLVKIIRKLNMYRLDLSPPNPGFQSPPGSLHF